LSIDALRTAIIRALTMVDIPGRAGHAIDMVRADLSIERMAGQLVAVYRELVPASVSTRAR
jgi:hypothetical protein